MADTDKQPSFLFHDYETFGTRPALDRPAQFAAIRTDLDFNIIGEPEVFYCKPADDYLPQPEAVPALRRRLRRRAAPAKLSLRNASMTYLPCPIPAWWATTMCVSMTK